MLQLLAHDGIDIAVFQDDTNGGMARVTFETDGWPYGGNLVIEYLADGGRVERTVRLTVNQEAIAQLQALLAGAALVVAERLLKGIA